MAVKEEPTKVGKNWQDGVGNHKIITQAYEDVFEGNSKSNNKEEGIDEANRKEIPNEESEQIEKEKAEIRNDVSEDDVHEEGMELKVGIDEESQAAVEKFPTVEGE